MKIRSGPELFTDLMGMTADVWNVTLAKELGMTLEELKYAFNDPPVNKDDMQDMADAYATAYSSYLDEYMWKKGLL